MRVRARATVAVATAALLAGTASCVHHPEPEPGILITRGGAGAAVDARPIPREAAGFWEAVANLDLVAADRHRQQGDRADFVDALRLTLSGDTPGAKAAFLRLSQRAEDSIVRAASRITLAGVLQYDGDWATLAELPRDSLPMLGITGDDPAGVERWAAAFRELPAERYDFRAEVATLPLAFTTFGTPVMVVTVNGRTKRFWLDTGSSLSIVASDVAEECHVVALRGDTLQMVTATGRVAARPAVIGQFGIGPLELTDHPAVIVDAASLQLRRPAGDGQIEIVKVDGIIGFHAIRRMDLELDYASATATIRRPQPRTARRRPPNLYWLGYPVVRLVGRDGTPLHFALDTGADETFATWTLLTKVPYPRLRAERRRIVGFGGEERGVVPVIPDMPLVVGERRLHFRNLVVTAPRRLTFMNLDGVLGSDIGKSARMRIDMTNGVFGLEPSR